MVVCFFLRSELLGSLWCCLVQIESVVWLSGGMSDVDESTAGMESPDPSPARQDGVRKSTPRSAGKRKVVSPKLPLPSGVCLSKWQGSVAYRGVMNDIKVFKCRCWISMGILQNGLLV